MLEETITNSRKRSVGESMILQNPQQTLMIIAEWIWNKQIGLDFSKKNMVHVELYLKRYNC